MVSVKTKRTECHEKPLRKGWPEDLVVSETLQMVMDDTAIEAIVSILMDLQDRENVNLSLYEQLLRETVMPLNKPFSKRRTAAYVPASFVHHLPSAHIQWYVPMGNSQ